jgi:glycosyltransferase involved in cell wall biosynthesis
MEALACGTPVITFRTGGSPEILNEKTGAVVECDDIDAFETAIVDSLDNGRFARVDCVNHARRYDQNERFLEYIELIQQ